MSDWYIGKNYDAKFGKIVQLSEYRYKCDVYIRDKKTGKITKRAGDGRSMGNFSPCWINWKGKKIQVESLCLGYKE